METQEQKINRMRQLLRDAGLSEIIQIKSVHGRDWNTIEEETSTLLGKG